MANTALITGASSGIGMELARYHAAKGGDLVLVARRQEALDSLKIELEASQNVSVNVIAMDLAKNSSAEKIHAELQKKGIEIDILINNAGFGGHGHHIDRDLDAELGMIDLNIKALVSLTHMFAKDMAARGKGKILNVGSTAGFIPGPNQAVYFATKAFVNSFSQALDQELRKTGVTCTVLAPGYVETEFAKQADLEGTQMVNQGGASAEDVARFGYEAMMDGKLVVVNDKKLGFLLNWVTPLLPRRIVLKMIERTQSKA